MKKLLTYFLLLFISFWILWSNVNATTFIQKSIRQNSAAVANNDPVTVWKWNAIVLDLSNIIEDIWNLKTYIDTNIANNFVYNPATDRLENTNRDIKISKKLIINWTLEWKDIDLSEWGLSDNVIFSNNIKNWTVKKEDFANNVQFWNEEYWKENGLDIYYDLWNIWIWIDTPNEKVEVKDWNIKIKTNWNGIIYPDGTLQTTAFNWITDAVTLNWNHKRDGSHANPYILSQDYKNCREIQDSGKSHWDWYYIIKPNWWKVFQVYCDMTTDWGWWTRFVNSKGDFSFNTAKKCFNWDIIDNDRLECFNPNVYNQKTTKLYLKEEWQNFFYDNSWNDTPTTNRITAWHWNYTCKGWGVMNIMIWWSNIPTIYNANRVRFGRSFCEFWWEVGWRDGSTHYMNYDWEKQFWLPSGNWEFHSKNYEFYYRDKMPTNNTIISTPIEYNWIQWIDGEKKFKKDIILTDWSIIKSIKWEWNAFTWNETDNAIVTVESVRNLVKNNKWGSDFAKCWGSNGWFLKYVKDYNTSIPDIPCEWWNSNGYLYENDWVSDIIESEVSKNMHHWVSWSCSNHIYKSCVEIKEHNPSANNWYYTINPWSGNVNVYCDMTTDGGWWRRVIKEDYNNGTSQSWWNWNSSITTCWEFWNILGWYNKTSTTPMYKTFSLNNITHNQVLLKGNYIQIDSWDWEEAYVKLNNTKIYSKHYWHPSWSKQVCWKSNSGWLEYRDNVAWKINNSSNSIKVTIGSTLNQWATNESYWFDNLELFVRNKVPVVNNWNIKNDNIACSAFIKAKPKDNRIKIKTISWIKKYSDWTVAKSCLEYKNWKDAKHQYIWDIWDGTYTINPWSGNVNVYCDMTNDWGWWTLVYKWSWQSTMKTTWSQNVSALNNKNYSWTWKLSDNDIKALYTQQFRVRENGSNFTNFYCKFRNISDYADNRISYKYCEETYSPTASYSNYRNDWNWQYWFSTWDWVGSYILQLNYRDSRKGAHRQRWHTSSNNNCDVKNWWNDWYGCYVMVWIK